MHFVRGFRLRRLSLAGALAILMVLAACGTPGQNVVEPVITSFEVELTTGSQFEATWVGNGAESYEILAVNPNDTSDTVSIPGGAGLSGTTSSVVLPIPASTHQLLMLVATNSAGSDSAEASGVLQNVVLNTGDYDPYNNGGRIPDSSVPGTLRDVVLNAPEGAIVGFASDVVDQGTIQLFGVAAGSWGDAHLPLHKDVRISAPASGFTLEGISAFQPGDPGDPFTYESRVIDVAAGATVTLDNLTITGGTFIYVGAGIRNLGDLTINNGVITGNRAWYTGGGVANEGSLSLVDTVVSGNSAETLPGEVGTDFVIRGNPGPAARTGVIDPGGWGGGIYNRGAAGSISLSNSNLTDNSALFTGAGLNAELGSGTVTFDGGSVSNNVAEESAGGIFSAAVLDLVNVDFIENEAADTGGGLVLNQNARATAAASRFERNTADYSGAIQINFCDTAEEVLVTTGITFADNQARVSGGQDDVGTTLRLCALAAMRSMGGVLEGPSVEMMEQGESR